MLIKLNETFLPTLKVGSYEKILKERSKIEVCLLDSYDLNCDKKYFRAVHRMDSFMYPMNRERVSEIEKNSGIIICCFNDWLKACECSMDAAISAGAVAFKTGLAYNRNLKFERVTKSEAEKEYNILFEMNRNPIWQTEMGVPSGKKFQDYMMHYIMQLANKRKLVYQIHTGLFAGKGSRLENSNPQLLTNLFIDYPDVKFDIFHIGYPFEHTLAALSKMFPNVYIDMCWAHVISPTSSVNALLEFLDSVPICKINGFGGVSLFLDAVYGHQVMARENISKALSIKVEENVFTMKQAKDYAKKMLYDNPVELFRL